MATDQHQTATDDSLVGRPVEPPPPPVEQSQGAQTQGAQTQVGQVIQELSRITRRLPLATTRRRPHPRHGAMPSRERLTSLLEALGDTTHPDHSGAVDELVEIGAGVVPQLNDVVTNQRSNWLAVYRATDALGRIGDGRATGALIQALQHANSNVRWNAVRALTLVGDVRALLELRKVAQHDHGKTSWGESVGGAAQSALDQIRTRSVWGQSLELVKTAVSSVLMILALILAFSAVSTLRNELDTIGRGSPDTLAAAPQTRPTQPAQAATAAPTVAPTVQPTAAPEAIGSVLQGANVRPLPNTSNDPIGRLSQGDEIIFLARSADGQWYRVRLGNRRSDVSNIRNPDGSGTGWVSAGLVDPPSGTLPVENTTAAPATTTTPRP
ncbi:MAG: SH3 domain-containing protein [Chloroflexaceae bacterium]|jgi:hypothetical protein|nr:SH3 domain-containing protein [Chloroflexaceae bacterium]